MAKKIIVHDGLFHADDVITVALANIEECCNLEVERTRKIPEELYDTIVADVGKVYDPENLKFDHHQDDVPVYENGIKMSACGLYLKEMTVIDDYVKEYLLAHSLYAVQARDNGQDVDPIKYPNNFSFIATLNVNWDEGSLNSELQMSNFHLAVAMATVILQRMISKIVSAKRAEETVNDAMQNQKDGIMYLPGYMPWIPNVVAYNNEHPGEEIKICTWYDSEEDRYKIQVVPKELGRMGLNWAFIPEEATKIEDFIFRHQSGFMAIYKTASARDEALALYVKDRKEIERLNNASSNVIRK